MQANLFFQSYATQKFVAFDTVQAKERSDKLLPLTIEIFDCLNKHNNMFLHDYANVI